MIYKEQISSTVRLLQEARRPVFIWGAGMRPYAEQARALARSLGIPVACTWGAIDLMNYDDPLMAGGFGTHGTRAANFTVQNADLIISLGSRLDTKATGDPKHFARAARIVMVDIDNAEIQKFEKLGLGIDVYICGDAGEFLDALRKDWFIAGHFETPWTKQVRKWRDLYDTPKVTWPGINPYQLMKEIAQYTTKDDIICSDTGTALGYLMQAFPFKGERFIHAFNMTPMGYGLPAVVGASFARMGKRVVLVTGDGSIMMSLPELSTVARWNLNIKIILLNNQGHAMCRQTQRQWLGGNYYSTSVEGGLGFPDWWEVFFSFRIPVLTTIGKVISNNGPGACIVGIHPDAQLIPQARYGQPIEDADPQLPRDEFRTQMIVEPL